ncbi:hypothetical protein V1283_007402 [Bradyrhizobium sp. AZCC 2262]|uniref:hypothetical protein n=1 Tax=Bradyrhizobium sp. AZCC 2262 TaxID=3117022 RepID=UPI002FF40A97
MVANEVAEALRKSIASGHRNPFVTYAEFAREHGFSDKFPPAWANAPTLDAVADALKRDSQIGLDLTFLIRSAKTGYPSVIDGKPFDGTPHHKLRAREEADKIIKKFGLAANNPY